VVTGQGIWIVDAKSGPTIKSPGQVSGPRSGQVFFINTSTSPVTLYPEGGAERIIVEPGAVAKIAGTFEQPTYSDELKPIGDQGPARNAIIFPCDVAVNDQGTIYISDWGNDRVRRIDAATGTITSLNIETSYPTGLALDAQGRLYIADRGNNRIL